MKPVVLTAAATRSLPRWGLILFVCTYALVGMADRAPWKDYDAIAFGVMRSMQQGGFLDWLMPNVAGLPLFDQSPLAFWIGTVSMMIFGPLFGDVLAGRLPALLYVAIASLAVWRWAYHLARHKDAQPHELPFGGQPTVDNYARMCADSALLIYLGSLGLLIPAHSAGSEALLLALASSFFALSVAQNNLKIAVLRGVILGLIILGFNLPTAIVLWGLQLALHWRDQHERDQNRHDQRAWKLSLLLSLPIMLGLMALWLGTIAWYSPFHFVPQWLSAQSVFITPSGESLLGFWDNIQWLISNAAWFTWPALPFALWALKAWRGQWRHRHIRDPLVFLIGSVMIIVLAEQKIVSNLLLLLPSLAMLAAFGIPTMRRSGINGIDWFALMIGSAFGILIWLGWCAQILGWPAGLAGRIAALTPTHHARFELFPFALSVVASLVWIRLAMWRISTRPKVLWRAIVLSIGAVLLAWLLLMSLWIKAIDASKSYAMIAAELGKNQPQYAYCVNTENLALEQRALFYFYIQMPFSSYAQPTCSYLLQQASPSHIPHPLAKNNEAPWRQIWQGKRFNDKREIFTLYQR